MSPKEKYRELCRYETTIPIFSRDWWLDAVCGDSWDVCVVERGGDIVASMPYQVKLSFGLTVLSQPPLTQTLGPWLKSFKGKYANRLKWEKDVFEELIRQLPRFSDFRQSWHFSQTNWLPFYWRGFKQTTRYTYRLEGLSDLDQIWSGFRENIRGDIRKAVGKHQLSVIRDGSPKELLDLQAKTFARQKREVPFSRSLVQGLWDSCAERGAAKIFLVKDDEDQCHAGLCLVWDEMSAYYLIGGGDPNLRSSGATSLGLWNAIQYASEVTKSFDFEGSMLEPVERFFRAFGATQTPYFSISKTPSLILQGRTALRGLLSKMRL